jgi:hypothetical protein
MKKGIVPGLLLLGIAFFSCSTHYLTVESFSQQLSKVKIHPSRTLQYNGVVHPVKTYDNGLKYIYCYDKKNHLDSLHPFRPVDVYLKTGVFFELSLYKLFVRENYLKILKGRDSVLYNVAPIDAILKVEIK